MAFEYLRLIQGTLKEKEELIFPQMNLPSCFIEQRYDLIIAPGGNIVKEPGKYLRSWPLKNYALLATRLVKEKKKVAIVGSESDKYIEKYFPSGVDSYVGKFDLGQLLDFYQKGSLLITHDSGPMHLGILAGIKVLALFGPTIPMEKVPSAAHVLWGGEKLSCRPCYDGKCYAKCNRPLCMEGIEIDQVYEKIMSLL
jgi:heptosyltransferase-2